MHKAGGCIHTLCAEDRRETQMEKGKEKGKGCVGVRVRARATGGSRPTIASKWEWSATRTTRRPEEAEGGGRAHRQRGRHRRRRRCRWGVNMLYVCGLVSSLSMAQHGRTGRDGARRGVHCGALCTGYLGPVGRQVGGRPTTAARRSAPRRGRGGGRRRPRGWRCARRGAMQGVAPAGFCTSPRVPCGCLMHGGSREKKRVGVRGCTEGRKQGSEGRGRKKPSVNRILNKVAEEAQRTFRAPRAHP